MYTVFTELYDFRVHYTVHSTHIINLHSNLSPRHTEWSPRYYNKYIYLLNILIQVVTWHSKPKQSWGEGHEAHFSNSIHFQYWMLKTNKRNIYIWRQKCFHFPCNFFYTLWQKKEEKLVLNVNTWKSCKQWHLKFLIKNSFTILLSKILYKIFPFIYG